MTAIPTSLRRWSFKVGRSLQIFGYLRRNPDHFTFHIDHHSLGRGAITEDNLALAAFRVRA